MATKTFETKWKRALTSILEELNESQFKKMLFCLDKDIPQGVVTGKAREEIPRIIIQHLGSEKSLQVIKRVMAEIPRRDAAVQDLLQPLVDELKTKRQEIREVKRKPASASGSKTKKAEAPAEKKRKPASASGSKTKKAEAPAARQKSDQPAKKKVPQVQKGRSQPATKAKAGKVVQKSAPKTNHK